MMELFTILAWLGAGDFIGDLIRDQLALLVLGLGLLYAGLQAIFAVVWR